MYVQAGYTIGFYIQHTHIHTVLQACCYIGVRMYHTAQNFDGRKY